MIKCIFFILKWLIPSISYNTNILAGIRVIWAGERPNTDRQNKYVRLTFDKLTSTCADLVKKDDDCSEKGV